MMKTGIKALDVTIDKHHIAVLEHSDNDFQKAIEITPLISLNSLKVPYCMVQIIRNERNANQRFTIHRFHLPYNYNKKFADFLVDETGRLVEQVCYIKTSKYQRAFNVIKNHYLAQTNMVKPTTH